MPTCYLVINATGRDHAYTFRRVREAARKARSLASLLEDRFRDVVVFTDRTRYIHARLECDASEPLIRLLETLVDERGWGRFAVGIAVSAGGGKSPPEARTRGGDGPAAALAACRRARASRVAVEFVGFGRQRDPDASSLANTLLWIRSRWPHATRALILRSQQVSSLRALARELGVSPPAVSTRLTRAGWPLYQYAREHLDRMLSGGLAARSRRHPS